MDLLLQHQHFLYAKGFSKLFNNTVLHVLFRLVNFSASFLNSNNTHLFYAELQRFSKQQSSVKKGLKRLKSVMQSGLSRLRPRAAQCVDSMCSESGFDSGFFINNMFSVEMSFFHMIPYAVLSPVCPSDKLFHHLHAVETQSSWNHISVSCPAYLKSQKCLAMTGNEGKNDK